MKNHFLKKVMPGVLSAAMVLGNCPVLSLAASDGKDQEISARETERSQAASPSNPERPGEETRDRYVLMNIPYGDFYENEVSNETAVDGVTSATLNKTRTGTLVGGSYHEKSDGTRIDGITFPVKVGAEVDLSQFHRVTEGDSVEITVTNRGQESTVVYEGRDALFENRSYAYYELDEEPGYYKELTEEDGKLSFSQLVSASQARTLDGSDVELMTESGYGDYQISLGEVSGLEMETVYGVILKTREGSDYGLRHLENIWRKTELAWSAGFTEQSHGSPLSSAHYETIMGQTIDQIVCYTDQGVYEIDVDLYVPVKFDGKLSVEDALEGTGSTEITATGFPEDYNPEYKALDDEENELDIQVEGDVLYYSDGEKGKYTLTVSDGGEVYAPLSASFILYTEDMPVEFNQDSQSPALTVPEGWTQEQFADYISNITSVTVNGTNYPATGRNAVTIINEDGTINTEAAPFVRRAAEGVYEMTVFSTGYRELNFTYRTAAADELYVLMNIPYDKFYEEEVTNETAVDAVTSATMSKPRTGTLAGGSYHADSDGSHISGITFPVRVDASVDLSSFARVTDESAVEITVTNRGQTTTTVYEGKEALFENSDYAYYVLTEKPQFYKVMTADGDGFSFSAAQGERQSLEAAAAELMTESSYGDYQVSVDLAGLELDMNSDKVYAVVLETKEGSSYGLRHLENIWRGVNLAWSVGYTLEVHNCPVRFEHYKGIMGQTINKIIYYTSKGIYEIPADLYVPVKFGGEVSVEDASKDAGSTKVTFSVALPEDFQPGYYVRNDREEVLEVSVMDGVMTFSGAAKGRYTLTVRDDSGKYAPLITTFILYTEDMPARYNQNGKAPALVKAGGASDEEFEDYIKNITSVSVNGKSYSASGRGAVVIVKEDGTIDTEAEPFAQASEGGSYQLEVFSTGYKELAFTYRPAADSGNISGGSTSSGSRRSGSGGGQTSAAATGHWVSQTSADGRTVWIYQSDQGSGAMYAGSWAYLHNPFAAEGQPSYGWFHFGTDGVMDTGWFTDTDGNQYYLDTAQSGSQGMALTGWQTIDGKWYYFRGWDGAPYGSLLTDGQTPDGYSVDKDGAWIASE